MGTFLGTFISVNGVDRNKVTGEKFRVWQLGQQSTGRLLLGSDLTDLLGKPLPAGIYNFTFFGIADTAAASVPPTSTPFQASPAYLDQLRDKINSAKKIEDPGKQARTLQRLQAWLKLVVRGVDPNSPEGQIERQLVNARTIPDPVRREKTVDRLLARLERLKTE